MFAWLEVCFFLSSCKTLVLRVSKYCSGGTTVNLLSVDLRFPSWRRIDILINSVNVFFLDSATRCLKHRQQQQPNPCPVNNPSQRLGPKGVRAWKTKSIDSIVRCVSFSELQHWLKIQPVSETQNAIFGKRKAETAPPCCHRTLKVRTRMRQVF